MAEDDRWIYETDDGGLTIYRRRFGDPFREVVRSAPPGLTQRSRLWIDHILPAAESDPVLDDMIGKVEMHHALKN